MEAVPSRKIIWCNESRWDNIIKPKQDYCPTAALSAGLKALSLLGKEILILFFSLGVFFFHLISSFHGHKFLVCSCKVNGSQELNNFRTSPTYPIQENTIYPWIRNVIKSAAVNLWVLGLSEGLDNTNAAVYSSNPLKVIAETKFNLLIIYIGNVFHPTVSEAKGQCTKRKETSVCFLVA